MFVFLLKRKRPPPLHSLLSEHRLLKAAMFAPFHILVLLAAAFDAWRKDMKDDVSSIKVFFTMKVEMNQRLPT